MKKGFFLLLSKISLIIAIGFYVLNGNAVGMATFNGTGTTTTAPKSADSRKIVPPVITTVKPQYPGVDIPSTVLPDDMSTLDVCPVNPVCPDINGKFPDGTTSMTSQVCSWDPAALKYSCVNTQSKMVTCPSVCTVTRTVDQTTMPNGTVKINSSVAAACPPGYSAIAVYNVGKEITYQSNPPPAPFPVPDMNTMKIYRDNNYNCTLVAQTTPFKSCGQQITTFTSGIDQVISNLTLVSGMPTIISGVGQWTYNSNAGCYLKGSSCSIANPVCGDAFDMLYTYYYSFYKCTPPAGLYYTNNTIPTAVVCTVAKPVWHTAQ